MLFVVYFKIGMSDVAKVLKPTKVTKAKAPSDGAAKSSSSDAPAKASTDASSPRTRSPPPQENPKRHCPRGNGGSVDGSDSEGELSAMFSSLRSQLSAEISAEVRTCSEAISTKNMGHIESTIRAIEKKQSKRMDVIETEVSGIRSSQASLLSAHDLLRDEVASLRRGLAASESSAASDKWVDDTLFDRLPAPQVIRLNTESLVSLQAISSMVNTWFADASLEPKNFSIQGGPSPLSRNFRITLKGEEGLAGRRAKKALDTLRLENGSWTELFCKSPSGSSVRAYAGPDRNAKQMATERLAKKLLAGCKGSFDSSTWACSKRDGIVTLDGLRIVKVCPHADKSFELLWDNTLVAQYELDKTKIQLAFEGLAALGADSTEWAP